MKAISTLEKERQILQINLDSQKTRLERNQLGQFSTPIALANDILKYGLALLCDKEINFIDPAVGTGAFYSALEQNKDREIKVADGYDIDPFYATPTIELWQKTKLEIQIEDFTNATPRHTYNLTICNPPYVRHHHIDSKNKSRLKNIVAKQHNLSISGYAGLYCYFMLLADKWMSDEGLAGWLIPSEFMDVNYGDVIKKYLLRDVTLLHIHRFDPTDVQFSDALVSSAVVWFKKKKPTKDHQVKFTFGGTLDNPKITKIVDAAELAIEKKWTRFPLSEVRLIEDVPRLGDLFNIKRGIATGNNSFFILSEGEIREKNLPIELFRPILPSARYISTNIIEAEPNGNPMLDKNLFLLDTSLPEAKIKQLYSSLWDYLQRGKSEKLMDTYICSHRSPWYSQEKRPTAPIFCTYMVRSLNGDKTFRFLLNKSQAIVTNSYLAMYPTKLLLKAMQSEPDIIAKIWEVLNSLPSKRFLSEGRVYGGGLYKMEPKELARVPIPFPLTLFNKYSNTQSQLEIAFA
jgi:adenine-specific DNA-methyltransferase